MSDGSPVIQGLNALPTFACTSCCGYWFYPFNCWPPIESQPVICGPMNYTWAPLRRLTAGSSGTSEQRLRLGCLWACLLKRQHVWLRLCSNVRSDHSKPATRRAFFQFNLIYLEGNWASCRFPHMAARCTIVIKCLLWLADLAVGQAPLYLAMT